MAKNNVVSLGEKKVTGVISFGKIALWIVVSLVILLAAFYFAPKIPDMGIPKPSTNIDLDVWYLTIPGYLVGLKGTVALEALIIQLMIFLILFVAISDILQMFSSFSTWVAWVIGFGIAGIAGLGGAVTGIAQIFGLTAGLSAIGIGLIIVGSLVAAVTLNMGIGGWMREWRLNRQNEVTAIKGAKGRQLISEGIRTFKTAGRETIEGEKE